jgi:phage shock protein C
MLPAKRLYRSRDNRMLCGVAAGVGDYLGVDPTIVRFAWVILLVFGLVPAAAVYVAGCLLIPDAPVLD